MATSKPGLPSGITVYRGKYRVRIFFDGRQVAIGTFDALKDAKAALTLAQSQKLLGTFVAPSQRRAAAAEEAALEVERAVTFGEWAETWLQQLEADPHHSRATTVSYRSVMRNHILPTLGDYRLVDLTPRIVSELLAKLTRLPSVRHPGQRANGVAPTAARVLRSCLNRAVKQQVGGLREFKFPEAPKPVRVRPKDEDGDVATPAEVAVMADAMPSHLRLGVLLAAYCALRLGEVLGLERRDFSRLDDPDLAMLHVRRQWNTKAAQVTAPKTDSERSIAIPSFLLPDIVAHLAAHTGREPRAFVFSTPSRKGTRASQTQFDKAWQHARVVAGRPLLRFHDLRHTGLTLYAQQGATLAELLHRGGHSDVSVALRYQHATAARDRTLTQRLDRAISQGLDT